MQKTLVGALMLALAMAPAAAFAKEGKGEGRDHRNPFASIPVTGTSGFSGTMDIVGWTQDATGAINAIGVLNGTIPGVGTVADQVVTWPLATTARTAATTQAVGCQILNLDLGALNLDLLGLVVTLAPVHLNITAVPGAGNLLGNLLCAVVNLLNGGALGGLLTTLLNNLTVLLGGLGL
jgi:hypothetical protein